jgi:uncharacterized protein (UPF0332 family)
MAPERFLDLALILKGGPATAENYRTAISRAYYAAFHVGVAMLETLGIRTTEGPGGHGDVVRCLSACHDHELQEAGVRLRILHSRRRQADYKLTDPNAETRREADLACLDSREIIERIDSLDILGRDAESIFQIRQFASDILKLEVR